MLYLYSGTNSGTNQAVLDAWRTARPGLEIFPRDMGDLVGDGWRFKPRAVALAIKGDGPAVLLKKRRRFAASVRRTGWMMEEIARITGRLQNERSYDFSFAVGTTLPVMKPRQPHFIYSDLCIKANQLYPVGRERLESWKDAIPHEEKSLAVATGIFTMSDHVSNSLIDFYDIPADRVHRVNGGCNSPVELSNDPGRYAKRNILFIGTNWQIKAGDRLVAAFRVLRERFPDATLTIVGCTPDVSGPGIEVVGMVPQSRIAGYLAKASIYAMVSLREAFGIVYIEAMKSGLPVVAADLGATPDFVINGKTGFRVTYDDTDALIDRLATLLADPGLCRRLGEAGRELAMTEYTYEATLEKMCKVIGGALDCERLEEFK